MLSRDKEDIFKLPNQTSENEKIQYLRLKKKSTLNGINNRLSMVEEKITKSECISIETIEDFHIL